MYENDDILQGARAIRPYLPKLLGSQSEELDERLAQLLQDGQRGKKVDNLIVEVLRQHEGTRKWIAEFLESRTRPEWVIPNEDGGRPKQQPGKKDALFGDEFAHRFGKWRRPNAVIGANWILAEVRDALRGHPDDALILIRRWHPERILWYIYRKSKLTWLIDAATKMGLVEAYRNLACETTDEIEKAIAAREQGLQATDRDAMPVEWVRSQMALADIYRKRLRGERATNLERAIAGYESALDVATREGMPAEWAKVQTNRANAYMERILGDRSKNLEEAIAGYERAGETLTRDKMPEQWAQLQIDLAIAYSERTRGERVENLTHACKSCESALAVLGMKVYGDSLLLPDGRVIEYSGVPLWKALKLREEDADASADVDLDHVSSGFSGVLTKDDDALIVLPREGSAQRSVKAGGIDANVTRRLAYGYLNAPVRVDVDQEFELDAGILGTPTPNVTSTEIKLPSGAHTLDVTVVGEGFEKRSEERWKNQLAIGDPISRPAFRLHLKAKTKGVKEIAATYARDGKTVGYAQRLIVVGQDVSDETLYDQEPGRIAFEADGETPDLTIEIVRQGDALHWNFQSPHEAVKEHIPTVTERTNLEGSPERFARDLLKSIPSNDGSRMTSGIMRGIGTTISAHAPSVLWELLRRLPRDGDRVPAVLLLTNEPFIPWELALLDGPPEVDAPPFLAAQYNVGRWVLSRQRPKNPPPTAFRSGNMIVFWGKYEDGRWRALPAAVDEAKKLETLCGATRLTATEEKVVTTLSDPVVPAVIHFAGHGQYGGGGTHGGLILGDGKPLPPAWVRGLRFRSAPFVFLNACEAGVAEPTLSLFTGMPPAFLVAGAAAVVAPLWKVDDGIARDIALEFHSNLQQGMSAGEALRHTRRSFKDQTTYLAYQLYGDPSANFTEPSN